MRWHRERTRHWINWITLSTLHSPVLDKLNRLITLSTIHSPVLDNLNRLISILHCNRCIGLNRQLQDELMGQQESDRVRFVVRKLWDFKVQIHMIEKENAQLTDVIGHIITLMLDLHFEGIITRSLFSYVCVHLYIR